MRAEGVEPSRAFAGPTDFRATSAFAAASAFVAWTIPSACCDSPQFSRCPSSLYTFPAGNRPSGLGSGSPFQVSPTLGSSASPLSRRALKSPQVRCVCQFRHTRVAEDRPSSMIGQSGNSGFVNLPHDRCEISGGCCLFGRDMIAVESEAKSGKVASDSEGSLASVVRSAGLRKMSVGS